MPTTARPEPQALALQDVAVAFRQRGGWMPALGVQRLEVAPGSLCGVSGPSGSGKTTMLHLIGGLLRANAGTVCWGGTELGALSERARDRWRRRHVGFVFQDFHLIPELSALDNVLLPAWFAAVSAAPWRARARALLGQVGIAAPSRRAALLSRGEQQRVAIARALLHEPAILLADEPTASLDDATGATVGDLLVGVARGSGATLIAVSHDRALLERMEVVHRIEQGRLA